MSSDVYASKEKIDHLKPVLFNYVKTSEASGLTTIVLGYHICVADIYSSYVKEILATFNSKLTSLCVHWVAS